MTRIPLEPVIGGSPDDGASHAHRPHGWVAEDDYKMLSMAFTLKSVEAQFARALRWHLAPFALAKPAPGGFPVELLIEEEDEEQREPLYTFRFATQVRYQAKSVSEVAARAAWEIHSSVSERVRDFVLLHSGAVARNGGALLLPARTESGKSSLTLGLLEAGFSYLSDELGALDPVTERAYPFAKRIKLIPDALGFFPGLEERLEDRTAQPFWHWERYVRPEDVGAAIAGPSLVRWLVFPTRDFTGPPRLEPMSKAQSVEAMSANCFNLFRYGEAGVVLLSRIAMKADAFVLDGGSLRERVALLSERLG